MDDEPAPRWRRLLLNRFVLTPLALAVIAAGWDAYAVTHAHGVVQGQVVDSAGRPVAGAVVTLWTYNFTTYVETSQTSTDGDGRFGFTKNFSHRIQINAAKPGAGSSPRHPVRLYFRAQDTTLTQPLVLLGN